MRIGIVTPAAPGSRYGNRVSALRWARILRGLGHSVAVKQAFEGESWDLLVALHARRSGSAIERFRAAFPERPIVLALTGTDVYRDIRRSSRARRSIETADRLVVLQPNAVLELEERQRAKARVIFQSVEPLPTVERTRRTSFDVCVVGHLRSVKDPFRAAMAARLMPRSSRLRVVHVGAAMTPAMEARARAEMERNRRYIWLGEQPRSRVMRLLASSDLCALSSRMEGGANALGEAIVAGAPILASRIPGTTGILGDEYPGYFSVGATRALGELFVRAENDSAFVERLRSWAERLRPLFDPEREIRAWADLLDEV